MLKSLAIKAREQRLEGEHHDNGSLHGYCFDNAFVLYNLLKQNGFNCRIVCGASELYSSEVLQSKGLDEIQSVTDLEGQVHYWVESEGKVVDISSDIRGHIDEVIVSNNLPQGYYRLTDSYEYARDILESARSRRCWYCGGRRGYCGCPEEQ